MALLVDTPELGDHVAHQSDIAARLALGLASPALMSVVLRSLRDLSPLMIADAVMHTGSLKLYEFFTQDVPLPQMAFDHMVPAEANQWALAANSYQYMMQRGHTEIAESILVLMHRGAPPSVLAPFERQLRSLSPRIQYAVALGRLARLVERTPIGAMRDALDAFFRDLRSAPGFGVDDEHYESALVTLFSIAPLAIRRRDRLHAYLHVLGVPDDVGDNALLIPSVLGRRELEVWETCVADATNALLFVGDTDGAAIVQRGRAPEQYDDLMFAAACFIGESDQTLDWYEFRFGQLPDTYTLHHVVTELKAHAPGGFHLYWRLLPRHRRHISLPRLVKWAMATGRSTDPMHVYVLVAQYLMDRVILRDALTLVAQLPLIIVLSHVFVQRFFIDTVVLSPQDRVHLFDAWMARLHATTDADLAPLDMVPVPAIALAFGLPCITRQQAHRLLARMPADVGAWFWHAYVLYTHSPQTGGPRRPDARDHFGAALRGLLSTRRLFSAHIDRTLRDHRAAQDADEGEAPWLVRRCVRYDMGSTSPFTPAFITGLATLHAENRITLGDTIEYRGDAGVLGVDDTLLTLYVVQQKTRRKPLTVPAQKAKKIFNEIQRSASLRSLAIEMLSLSNVAMSFIVANILTPDVFMELDQAGKILEYWQHAMRPASYAEVHEWLRDFISN